MSELVLALFYICAIMTQAAASPAGDLPDCLTPSDRSRLAKETKLDSRIKIYDGASGRCEALINSLIQREEFQAVPEKLKMWSALLDSATQDIESSPGRKDKSKALMRFEIHLRRSVNAMQELKIKALVEQQDDFELWINKTEVLRKKFVGYLFPA